MTCNSCHGACKERIGYDEKVQPVYGCPECKKRIIEALRVMVKEGKTFLVALYNLK